MTLSRGSVIPVDLLGKLDFDESLLNKGCGLAFTDSVEDLVPREDWVVVKNSTRVGTDLLSSS